MIATKQIRIYSRGGFHLFLSSPSPREGILQELYPFVCPPLMNQEKIQGEKQSALPKVEYNTYTRGRTAALLKLAAAPRSFFIFQLGRHQVGCERTEDGMSQSIWSFLWDLVPGRVS
jgi:hypothetical protein